MAHLFRYWFILTLSLQFACDCEPEVPGAPCTNQSDCEVGQVCTDGLCMPVVDGSTGDSGADSQVDVAEPECTRDDQCGEDTCVGGVCCAAESACGTVCCADADSCFAGTCVSPGETCNSSGDCADGEYCEPEFGDMRMIEPPPGRVCLGDAQNGRCLALPPACADGVMPGPGEVCITECIFEPEVATLNAVEQWAWNGATATEFPEMVDAWATPTVGRVYDTNCDGDLNELDPPNVVFVSSDSERQHCSAGSGVNCRNGVLRVLDGKTGQELWSLNKSSADSMGFAGMSVALGDLTGDGRMEIVAMTGERRVAIITGEGTVLTVSEHAFNDLSGSFGWGGGLALADMEGDGNVDIAYSSTVLTFQDGALSLRFEGASGEGGGGGRALSLFADLNGDGTQELVTGRAAYNADGTELWRRGGVGNPFPAVADFDADGVPEVVLVSGGQARIVSGLTGEDVYGPAALGTRGSGGPPTVADFDGDGAPEVGVAQADFYFMLKPEIGTANLNEVWRTPNHDFSSSVTGSTVFDFEGDGIAEVIYNDECFLWVYDGPTGAIRFATPTTSFTATEASLVADVDGDGHAEILMVSNGADPGRWNCNIEPWTSPDPDSVRPAWQPPEGQPAFRGMTLFRDVANSWVGTRSIWNQHTYHVSNICDDRDSACTPAMPYGSIPATEASNWSVPWLNNYRQNVQDEGIFNAPDATLSLEVDCGPPVTLVAAVRNLGQALLPPGVNVGFYQRDGGVDTLLGIGTTTGPVFPGGVQLIMFEPPAGTSATDVFVGKIEIDPLMRTFRECREDNNDSPEATGSCLL